MFLGFVGGSYQYAYTLREHWLSLYYSFFLELITGWLFVSVFGMMRGMGARVMQISKGGLSASLLSIHTIGNNNNHLLYYYFYSQLLARIVNLGFRLVSMSGGGRSAKVLDLPACFFLNRAVIWGASLNVTSCHSNGARTCRNVPSCIE